MGNVAEKTNTNTPLRRMTVRKLPEDTDPQGSFDLCFGVYPEQEALEQAHVTIDSRADGSEINCQYMGPNNVCCNHVDGRKDKYCPKARAIMHQKLYLKQQNEAPEPQPKSLISVF